MNLNNFSKTLLIVSSLLLGVNTISRAQQQTISGKVTDGDGAPVAGVVVMAKTASSPIGEITDAQGLYSISVPESVKALTYTLIGYEDVTENINGRKEINVTLHDEALFLDQAVSIGYAKVKRKDLTGASVSVGGDDLAQVPVTTAAQALTGKAAGVNITTQSGAPGSDINITIRGGSSITQSSSPLYIVDGFAMEDGLRMVDINDIETIDVLKDASSTAIYGAQGSNGVILITTKSGKEGKTQVTYNGYAQFERISKQLSMLGVEDYVKYQYEYALLNTSGKIAAWANMFGGSISDPNFYSGAYSRINSQYAGADAIDWQDLVFGNTAISQSHNVNITGGNEKTKFMISYNFNDQDGIMDKHGYKRNSIRAKINHQLWQGVRLDFSTSFSNTQTDGGGHLSSALRKTLLQPPTGGVLYTNDQLMHEDLTDAFKQIESQYDLDNPILENNAIDNNMYNRLMVMNGGIEVDILKNLTWRTAGSYSWTSGRQDYWDDGSTTAAETYKTDTQGSIHPYGSRRNSEKYSYQITNTLNYNTSFDNHNISALIGQEILFNHSQYEANVYYGFPENNFGLNNIEMASSYSRESNLNENAIASVFARAMYNYSDKYLLTLSARADGSSKFASGHKWGFFPSASAAWRISQEDFYRNSFISDFANRMKLRFGYGATGNCNVDDYMYTTAYGAGHYAINNTDVSTLVPSKILGNPELKWETTRSLNAGIDFGFARDRVNMSLDWYDNRSDDLIILTEIPNTTGYSSQYQNLGAIRNRGVELVLNSINIDNKDLRWTTDFNISFNRSKVLSLYGDSGKDYMYANQSDRFENWSAPFLVQVGQPIGQFFGYVYDGVYTTDDFIQNPDGSYILKDGIAYDTNRNRSQVKPGDMKFVPQTEDVDADGNPTYTLSSNKDRAVLGNASPKFSGGITNNLTFKGFDLYVFMNFSFGNKVWNLNKVRYYGPYLGNMNAFSEMAGRFTLIDPETGVETTDLARLAELNPGQYSKDQLWSLSTYNNYSVSCPMSLFVEDASFLRLNTITLGYTLPRDITRKANIEKFRVYLTLNNIYTFTNYSGYDPEVSTNSNTLTQGIDSSSFPKTRGCVLGVNVTF